MFEAELENDAVGAFDEELEQRRPVIECFLEAVCGRRADTGPSLANM